MNKFILIKDLANFLDQEVKVGAWLSNYRTSGKLMFLELRDGTAYSQAIVSETSVPAEVWQKCQSLTQECSLVISGKVSKHPKKEEYEIQVTKLDVIGASVDYPIANKEHGPDFLLDNRHLWLRSSHQWAIQKIRNTITMAINDFLQSQSFTRIDSPILTPNACEGTTELFEINYFDEGKAYLSQSGQLYLEAAISAHGRVYDFGPVFRAEKSKTRRHLTEFWMMDAEMAWAEHEDNLKIQEEIISFVVQQVLAKNLKELEILDRNVEALKKIQAPFIRMTHAEAVAKLQALGSDIKSDDDLGADDETLLTEGSDKPIFVTHWPSSIKAFYMKRQGDVALCDDLIATEGFGEVIGGSQREDNYDELLKRIKEHNLPVEYFDWYLDTRKYGSVPHSGFGIGLERLVSWITGVRHVRETIPFPRMINRIRP